MTSPSTTESVQHPFIPGAHTPQAAFGELAALHGFSAPSINVPQITVTVASVVPWPLETQAFFQLQGMPRFRVVASKNRKPEYCRLHNRISLLMDVDGDPHSPPAEVEKVRYAIDPRNPNHGYALDVINDWAGGRPSTDNGRLGVGIIIGKKPWAADNEATEEEIEHLHKIQKSFFDGRITDADNAHVSNDDRRKKQVAWGEARRALEYSAVLYGADVNAHPWYIPSGGNAVASFMVTCPACSERINPSAFMCSKCGTNIAVHFMERKVKFDEQKYPGALAEIRFLTSNPKGRTD